MTCRQKSRIRVLVEHPKRMQSEPVQCQRSADAYLLTWRRTGEPERIFHKVAAYSEREAIAASKDAMRLVLGANFEFWEMDTLWRSV